ncbi:MAG: SGNH/GDSL hydrolase family protein [Ruminococcaceae bacterium]|nr:SGNH/GDSL hydrolase family protein [Oscillospiraceae bacterium]
MFTLPEGAVEWADDGNGTLTASYESLTYYVSAEGSDENAGSAEAPLATIAEAIKRRGADEDFTIYVMGAYTFEDAAHTGTITYEPYDENAKLAAGTIKIQGPSVINVNTAKAATFYSDGYYLEIGGTVDRSIGNELHVGNLRGVNEHIVLKGQYFANVFSAIGGQSNVKDTLIEFDGAVAYNLRPDSKTTGGSNPVTSLGNLRVVLYSGELLFSNSWGASETDYPANTDSFLSYTFNNNTYHGITPHVFAGVTRTNFLDYFSSKFNYKGGESIWINTDTNGNTITPTATAGVYDVEGDKVAYFQTSDKKTVYYTYNGQIILPDLKNSQITWVDEFSTDLLATPGQQDGIDFVKWVDDGKGVITASYKKDPTTYEFYLKAGGTGDGKSVNTPAGTVADVIKSIKADGHAASSEVTVYIIDSGEKREHGDALTNDVMANYVMYQYGEAHDCKITFTTYDYENTKKPAVLYLNNALVNKSNTNTTLAIRGPETFENLIIVDCRTDFPTDVYMQGHDAGFINVDFRRAKGDATSASIVDKDSPLYAMQNRSGSGGFAEGGTIIVDNAKTFSEIAYSGYSDSANYDTTANNDVTFVIKNTAADGAPNVYTSVNKPVAGTVFKKNMNLILDNSTIPTFTKDSTDVIVEGAIQVVLNNGSVLTNFDAYKSAKASADAELGTAKWFVMDSKTNAGTLDITDTSGKFAVNADGKVAYAYSNDTRTAYYGADYLTIGESGSYVVNYVASVEDVIDALPELEPDAETGELFTGWTDNKDGTITASFALKTPETREYYVVNGGTGDGRSATTPAASVYDVIASVNADKLIKGDTAVIYIMEHPDFIDETTGKFGDEGKISTRTELVKGLFTYWKVDGGYIPEHTATLKITSYDYEEGNPAKPMKHVAYSDKIGANHMMGLSGPTIFEDVAIVRPRNVDREIRTNGYDVEFNNTIIYQTNGDFYTSTPFTGLVEDHANVIAGGDSATTLGGTLRFNSRLIASKKNNHGIGVRAYGKATTFTEPVAIYLNNSEINSQFNWGNANESYSVTLNAGLSIVSNAFTNIIYPTSANYLNDSPVNIAGGLQIVNNNGMIFPEVPSNVKADATWIVNSAKDAGGTLDITETAGTFKVLGGKYAYAQSFDKKTVWYGNETITLPAGKYTINYVDSFEAVKAAVETPADIDEYNLFDTWVDDGKGTLTAKYKYVIPTYYVAATGGADTNDGLTPETAFATTTKAIETIEANGKNGVINVIGAVTLDLVAHENKIYVESYNGGTVAGASNKISLCGPIVINADFTAAQAITTNGYYLELGGKVDNTQNNTITAGNLNGADEKIVLNGKFIHKLTTTLQNQKTGGLEIFIDGGILRQVSTGSGIENDGTYVVGNFSVTVKSGEFWCLNHSDAGPHKTPGVFNYIANGNNYYFPDGRQLLSSVSIKSWADYTPSGSDGFVKILFEGGKYVIRNADKENFIYLGESAGQFTYEGAKTPYYIAENGLTVNYGKDGKINLPTGEVDVIWTEEFKAEDMPEPTLASGYEFGGWADDGNGTLTALVINPNFYYVDGENGDDANLGTEDAPFKTISKAISALGGKNGKVYILGSAVYDLEGTDSFDGYVTFEGVGENAAIKFNAENVAIVGNTTFKNVSLSHELDNSYIYTFYSDARFEICDDVTAAFVDGPVAIVPNLVDNAKIILNGGEYRFDGSACAKTDIVVNNTELTLNTTMYSVDVVAENSSIYRGEDLMVNDVQIVANNCSVDEAFNGMDGITLIKSQSENGERVDFSTEDRKFSVKTEYGKTPIAVAEDGTVYVAGEFTTEDIAPTTWYDSHEYDEYINYRKPLNNTYKKLTEDKELKVAYFGGSVTNGSGKSDCWRALIGQWLIDNFPEAKVTNVNRACGESGTYLGTFRLQGDVIAIKPDLVFLEYSINDKYYGSSYANAASQYETIVREIKQALPETDIVTVLVSDTGTFGVNKQGKLHTQAQAHEDMAAIYGIPTLHVGRRIAEVCNYTASNFTGTYATDIVHLTSAGNYIYYQVIEEFFHNSLLRTDFAGLPERNEELPLTQNVLFDGNRTWYEPSADLLSKSEALGGSGVDFVNTPSYGGTFDQYNAGTLVTESIGQFRFNSVNDEFFFEFNGTDVALWSDYYKSNWFRISIDGGEYKDVEGTGHAPARIVEGLTPGNHKIGIKIKDASTSLTIRSIYTRDTSKATPAGTAHVYEDFANKTFTLPDGVYTVSYIDAETVADIPTNAGDGNLFLGWTDVAGETIADTEAIVEGMILVPDCYDVNDYITFEGVQIRLEDPMGLRFICELLNAGKEVEGVTVDSYGMVVLPSKVVGDDRTYADYDANVQNSTTDVVGADMITIGGSVEYNGKNYSVGTVEAKVLFDETDDSVLYTTCLIGLQPTGEAYATYYTLRPYMVVTANGQQYKLYGDAFRSSIYEVSKKAIEDTSVAGYDIFKGYVDAVEGNN